MAETERWIRLPAEQQMGHHYSHKTFPKESADAETVRRKNAKAFSKVVSRLVLPFRGIGVRTITTDNGCEFCAHEDISKMLGNVPVFFADSYASWQKGAIENS